ncbi:MAG: ATP-binding protein, partial [Candidatus Aenigmarchaeota archaeon]|nr:ATP-binding protein [Candidatus Aenigmarchaeota archaeon]
AVRGLHEKKEANIIVSGSTSSLLSKELGTLLAGRWLEMKVYPLDFREFLEFKGIAIAGRLDMLANKTQVKQLLREYLEFGGFPLAVLQDQKTQILQTYFDDILSRDVAERHRIRKVDRLRLLAKHYLTGFAAHISYRKAATMAGLSLQSAERFSAHLQDAFLVFFVAQFSYSLRQQVANPKVVYAIDTGIANAVGFRFSENVGRLYENLVFLSLLQQSQEVYYYKGKAECDFVVKEGQRVVQAIQVCYELGANKERELNGLNEAMAAFQLDEGTVITEGFEGEEQQAGKKVKYVPLWKWLLR